MKHNTYHVWILPTNNLINDNNNNKFYYLFKIQYNKYNKFW